MRRNTGMRSGSVRLWRPTDWRDREVMRSVRIHRSAANTGDFPSRRCPPTGLTRPFFLAERGVERRIRIAHWNGCRSANRAALEINRRNN
jgi:hypothetical protein